MSLNTLPVIISAVGNLALGLFVYTRNKKNELYRAFLFLCLILTVWNINILGLIIAPTKVFAWYWAKIFAIGLVLVPPAALRLILAFTEYRGKFEKQMLYVSYGFALFFSILNLSGLFVSEFFKVGNQYFPRAGLMFQLYILNFILFIGYSMLLVFRKYNQTISGIKRNQISYFLMAALFTALVGSTNFLPSFEVKIYPLGNMATIIFTSIVAYAIVKHRLMDIEVVIRKSVVYASLTVSITAIYAVIVGVFHGVFGIARFAQGSLLVNALAAMIIALSFQPLRNRIQRTVDKLFFKDKYDYHKTLKDFSGAMTSILSLDRLLNLIVNKVTEVIHIGRGCLMLWDEETEQFRIKAGQGLRKESFDKIYFTKSNYLVDWLEREKRIFNREEVELFHEGKESSGMHSEQQKEFNETLDKLKELGSMLCIPLMVKGRLIGIFSLDTKMSGEKFTTEDLELLSTVANQAAIAMENAKLYEEMREIEKNLHRADKLTALGTLASSIAHEIRNPLVSIKTFTQLAPRKFNSQDFLDKFQTIVPEELQRMETILNQLLNFSRPSQPEFYSVSVEEVIDSILSLMNTELSRSNIEVIKLYDKDVPQIRADGEQLRQVFMNIIMNAIQAMPEGGELKIITGLEQEFVDTNTSAFVAIRFEDTGCGIAEENLYNLFNPFFTTKNGGSGLGLSISRRIIKEHNGDINVESRQGEGTTFTVKLPLN
ncbi:GAF domain-containing protein [bacterium]|nr:GAF domain-containing protein [bacterium]NIN92015.1 GAF domain-containing protein [bacterium]NIO18231.1 GAF domain-containing protein [bacterium]NIO73205.1 GAF domain-containing protein [bacterium]